MYHGDYETKHLKRRRRRKNKKAGMLFLSLLLIALLAAGGTLAWLSAQTDEVKNTFTPGEITTTITENFDGKVKKEIHVKNEGNISAYIRVKLVSYRVNNNGDHIGGTTTIPDFNLGSGWVKFGDYYYYTQPVTAGDTAPNMLGDGGITLEEYADSDGGKQVIEVMAEAIQSVPDEAVGEAWGVKIFEDNVTPYETQGGAGE